MSAMDELPNPMNVLEFKITLQHRCLPDGTTEYRWRRSDGVWVSPEFTDGAEAVEYPKRHGFIPQTT